MLELIRGQRDRVHGIKMSLLSVEAEEWLRSELPDGVRMFTGDDFNYPQLVRGDGTRHSHALLGAFDPLAAVAAAALARLDASDEDGFTALLEPTVPLARHLFGAPTYYYKTGVVFLAWVNGHQRAFRMLGGYESARTVVHLAEAFRLAADCGAIIDVDRASLRMSSFLDAAGVPQK